MGVYPSGDIVARSRVERPCADCGDSRRQTAVSTTPCALVCEVDPDTPAWDAGFEPGCRITAVNGQPVRDIIDWRWLSADDAIDVTYIDLDGETGSVTLEREEGECWGFSFKGLVFDAVRQCRNSCTFCFIRQLPHHMRPSLALRDDDFRLSFLTGTFVTLTNLEPQDEARIIEQHISPLRVSLHAVDADIRRFLMGSNAAHGLEVLGRLLQAGIEFHAQIVLVPHQNDGSVLQETLEWAYGQKGILNVGIVPLGYTRHQHTFEESFDTQDAARAVLDLIKPFQQQAMDLRQTPWVYAADEIYCNAYGDQVIRHLPDARHYGDYSLFEDGIGIVRSNMDEFGQACESGLAMRLASSLRDKRIRIHYVAGYAMRPYFESMIRDSPLEALLIPLFVENRYFGGNVNVTGLLCGCDIAQAVAQTRAKQTMAQRDLFVIPQVIFNDDGITLDDMTVSDMEKTVGCRLHVVSCNPLDYLVEMIGIVEKSAEADASVANASPSSRNRR